MSTTYPGVLDTLTNPTSTDTLDSVTVPHATQHANANDAIEAIEAELGVDPAGLSLTVVARLDANDTAVGLKAPSASPVFTGNIRRSVTNAVSASATQTQVAATALTSDINRVTVVATAEDAVKLPAATAGRMVTVINANVTNAVGVFPASGDAINALAADAVSSLAAATTRIFACAVAGTWNF